MRILYISCPRSSGRGYTAFVRILLGITNDSIVTASHAIFVEKGGYKAPAAVVGLQYKHSSFKETFFNITSGVS